MLDRSRVRDLFNDAAELPAHEVVAFLERACGRDLALRSEVESLLAAARRRPSFLVSPTAAPLSEVAPKETPGTVIGRYRILHELGQGGFGSVYVAEQDEPVRRRVALKVIKIGMDTREVIARFEQERQALAMMDHANIAKVFDAGATESGRPYFVMELVRGDLITTYCDQANLDIQARLGLFVQVCHALQHAHAKGVVHRDIKPGNVLVTDEGGRHHAMIIDFGIAKAMRRDRSDRGLTSDDRRFLGTPEYMSPEQADGSGDVDTRADVYSLGVLLYELLTGTTPFDPASLHTAEYVEVLRIIREVEPPRPSTRVSTLGNAITPLAARRRIEPARLSSLLRGDLDWIVMRCLEKDRARRYPTSDALAADVQAFLRGDVVSAAPPSAAYRARKFIRRNRVGVLAGFAVAGALVLGTIGTGLGMLKAKDERTIANQEAAQARAISDFMRRVLTSVEPSNKGADVRLTEVLADASASASREFAAHPLLEAEVRLLLASVYRHLSLWDKCEAECRRAQSLYAQHAGPDDPRALSAERQALGSELSMGQVDKVEPALTDLLARLERVLGPESRTTLEARHSMANLHVMRGRLGEAEALLLELRSNRQLVDDDAMQVDVLISLIQLNVQRPELADRAERLAHWDQVAQLAQEAVDRSQRHSGSDAAITQFARVHLGMALHQREDFAAAARVYRAVLTDSEERLSPCHLTRVKAMQELANALARLGEIEEPADLYTRSMACDRESAGRNTIMILSGLDELMHLLDRAGRAKEGEAVARELATELAKYAGHVDPIKAELFVAGFVSMDGRYDEAEALFQPLLAKVERSGFPNARATAHLGYARHLTRLRRFEDSERHLEQCATLRQGPQNGTYDGLPDNIIFAFIELYKAWNKPDKVREYQALREVQFGIPPTAAP